MSEPSLDRQLREFMNPFESAVHAGAVELPDAVRWPAILAVLDGSNQDPLVQGLARELRRRTGAALAWTLADPALSPEEIQTRLAPCLVPEGEEAPARIVVPEGETPAARILAARDEVEAGVVVMPAPYLEDLNDLGEASVGTVTEVAVSRGQRDNTEFLLARSPRVDASAAFSSMLVCADIHPEEVGEALATALALAEPGARIRLLGMVHQDALEEIQDLLGKEQPIQALTEEGVLAAANKALAGYVAAAHRKALERSVQLTVRFAVESLEELAREVGSPTNQLVVTGCPEDPRSMHFARALQLVRLSACPVLLI